MRKLETKKTESLALQQEMMVVAHAEDVGLAAEYAQLLDDNGIPCRIRTREGLGSQFGVAIDVPEDFYDEAHMIIESAQDDNDFYDFFFQDPDSLEDELDYDFDEYEEDFE